MTNENIALTVFSDWPDDGRGWQAEYVLSSSLAGGSP